MRNSIIWVSILLLVASAYMYVNMSQTQVQLQSPAISFRAENKTPGTTIPDNPYVVRHGSNAMPAGMSAGGVISGQKQGIEPAVVSPSGNTSEGNGGQTPSSAQPLVKVPSQSPDYAGNASSGQPNQTKPGIDVGKGGGIEPGTFGNSGQSSAP